MTKGKLEMTKKQLLVLLVVFLFGVICATAFAATTIDGPKNAGVGELCVFNLTSPDGTADWQIVPQTDFYVDTSKRTLVFSSPANGQYTIIAATVEEGQPLALVHLLTIGDKPEPLPPTPNPEPEPTPEPKTLKDWVVQNIPPSGASQAVSIGDCFERAASSIDRRTIRTVEAAYASVRSCNQLRSSRVWGQFFADLEKQVSATEMTELSKQFREISTALKEKRE